MGHAMHQLDPKLFVSTVVEWTETLPAETVIRESGVFAKVS